MDGLFFDFEAIRTEPRCSAQAFYDHCQKAIADSPAEAKVTWATIKVAQASIIQKVVDTKFVEPKESEEKIKAHYDELVAEIESSFAAMLDV